MKNSVKSFNVVLLASTLLLVPSILSDKNSALFAQGKSAENRSSNAGGNGQGNANQNSRGNGNINASINDQSAGAGSGRNNANGNGGLARMLGGLNAYRTNPRAAENASVNSQVGRIATYVTLSENSVVAYDEWKRAYNEYINFRDSYEGLTRDEIEEQLAALDAETETYEESVAALEAQLALLDAHDAETANLLQISNNFGEVYQGASEAEDDALIAAAGGRTLSAEEEQQLRELLGL